MKKLTIFAIMSVSALSVSAMDDSEVSAESANDELKHEQVSEWLDLAGVNSRLSAKGHRRNSLVFEIDDSEEDESEDSSSFDTEEKKELEELTKQMKVEGEKQEKFHKEMVQKSEENKLLLTLMMKMQEFVMNNIESMNKDAVNKHEGDNKDKN